MHKNNHKTPVLVNPNSWYYSRPLKQCINLFQEEDNDYQAHFYACACGVQEVIVSSVEHTPTYVCEGCENQYFINAYHAMQEQSIYLHYEGVAYTYVCEHTSKGFKATAYLDVPARTHFMQKRISFKEERIESYEIILEHGKATEVSSPLSTELSMVLKRHLNDYIIQTYNDDRNILIYFKYEKNTDKQVKIVLFYLGLPKYLEYIFYFWKVDFNLRGMEKKNRPMTIDAMINYLLNNRTEHSLRQALIERYRATFWDNVGNKSFYNPDAIYHFDPLVPFVVSRSFDDPNIASMLLRNEWVLFEHNNQASDEELYTLHDVIWLIMFLKRHYSEKQIAKLLLSIPSELAVWDDILALVIDNKHSIRGHFNKVKLNMKSLHDEIVNCTLQEENKIHYHVNFTYEAQYKNACIVFGDMEFRLPATGEVVASWAHSLHNCLLGYIIPINLRYTTIYGVFSDNTLIYAVEISEKVIVQMSGKYNVPLPEKEAGQIKQWHKIHFNPTRGDKDAYKMQHANKITI